MNITTHHEFLQAYVTELARLMNLSEWTITLSPDLTMRDVWATVEHVFDSPRAEVQLSDQFFSLTPERQRQVLVHELLHLIAAPADDVLTEITGRLPKSTRRPLSKIHLRLSENAVDRTATLLAPLYPLPG